jgi:ABC-type multidrug transport system ATPase subunit
MSGHVLEADGIQLEIEGRVILQNIYLKVQTGQVLGLVGRNGQGKTSLMEVMYGSRSADVSSIRLDGRKLLKPYRKPECLTYLPSFHFIPTAYTIKRVWKDYGLDPEELFGDFPELKEGYLRPLSQYSSGLRRLVEACLIIMSPSWFSLLDEPFTHLMPLHIERLSEAIRRKAVCKGFIIADHAFSYLQEVSDRLALLTNGRTIPIRSKEDLIDGGFFPDDR